MTRRCCTPLLLLLAVLPLRAVGQRAAPSHSPDTVYIVPGSHLDIGFTAPLSAVREQRIRILDQAIAAAAKDPAFSWFEEGGWVVDAWLDRYAGQPSRIGALRKLVIAGRIGVGATLLSPHAAAFPEGLKLLTTHLDRVQQELGARPSVAIINDVPALPEAIIDALTHAGIKYLLAAPNLTFSPPLPAALLKQPFYWESSSGARLLVYLDAEGYGSASANWGLPPECASAMNPRAFPQARGWGAIVLGGVRDGLARRGGTLPLMVVQDAFDNWDTQCAQYLPAAIRAWNSQRDAAVLELGNPDRFFRHLEARFGPTLPVRRGEWGGDWDQLRATEPVWSWRLREAMRQVTSTTPRATRIALATATDHNVGLGTRWMGNLTTDAAMRHVHDVEGLYRSAVRGVLGDRGTSMVPSALPRPTSASWPAAWKTLAPDAKSVARIRAGGPGFLHPMLDDSAAVIAMPVDVSASADQLLVHAKIDRVQVEKVVGPRRFGVVLEVRIAAPIDQLRLAPENSPAAIAGRWLLGAAPTTVIAPGGVRVMAPGWSIRAHGPLIIAWSLARDAHDPRVTWLQALAFIDALEGDTRDGKLRRSFAELYPGEPQLVDYDLAIERLAAR